MLTDEERRDIDILRTATMPLLTPERTTLIAIALRTADSCERLDAELFDVETQLAALVGEEVQGG